MDKKKKVIGKVSHYFDKISVAAMALTAPLKMGDTLKIGDLTQVVTSMQIDRMPVESAKKGDDVAIKVDMPVKEGMEVEKV